jgi:hypothetical protein
MKVEVAPELLRWPSSGRVTARPPSPIASRSSASGCAGPAARQVRERDRFQVYEDRHNRRPLPPSEC